MSVSGDYTIFS